MSDGPEIHAEFLFTKTQVAKFFDVSVQAVTGWMNKGCPVHGKQGNKLMFYLPDVVSWREQKDRVEGAADDSANVLKLDAEKARLTKWQADNEELKNKKAVGELVEISLVEKLLTGLGVAVKSKLLPLPKKAAHACAKTTSLPEIEKTLSGFINEALLELMAYDLSTLIAESDKAGDESLGTPARTNNKRVGRPKKKTKPRK